MFDNDAKRNIDLSEDTDLSQMQKAMLDIIVIAINKFGDDDLLRKILKRYL